MDVTTECACAGRAARDSGLALAFAAPALASRLCDVATALHRRLLCEVSSCGSAGRLRAGLARPGLARQMPAMARRSTHSIKRAGPEAAAGAAWALGPSTVSGVITVSRAIVAPRTSSSRAWAIAGLEAASAAPKIISAVTARAAVMEGMRRR